MTETNAGVERPNHYTAWRVTKIEGRGVFVRNIKSGAILFRVGASGIYFWDRRDRAEIYVNVDDLAGLCEKQPR